MDFLPEIFAAQDGDCDVTNAFCFAKETVFLVLNAVSEENGLRGSALLKVNLRERDPTYEILHEFDSGSLDYHSEHADLHHILASGGYIHRIENGAMTFHRYAADAFLPELAGLARGAVAVFGENGLAFRFENGVYTPMPTTTSLRLYGMHFPRPDLGYAVGNYGTFLRGNGTTFTQIDLGIGEPLRAVHVKSDGVILVAGTGGTGLVIQGEELLRVEGNTADFFSVTEFQGEEYWGDDDFGVYTRVDNAFVPRFETGYAFNMNTANDLLTINAGYRVYIFDGSDWVHLQVNPDIDRMIERVPLDFVPH